MRVEWVVTRDTMPDWDHHLTTRTKIFSLASLCTEETVSGYCGHYRVSTTVNITDITSDLILTGQNTRTKTKC